MPCDNLQQFYSKTYPLIVRKHDKAMAAFDVLRVWMRKVQDGAEADDFAFRSIKSPASARLVDFRVQIVITPKLCPFFTPTLPDIEIPWGAWADGKKSDIVSVLNTQSG